MRIARHGTRSMYTKYECRCLDCQEANRAYSREYFRKRVAAAAAEGARGLHGRRSTYICGCRCEECRKAHRTYENAYRARIRAMNIPVLPAPTEIDTPDPGNRTTGTEILTRQAAST